MPHARNFETLTELWHGTSHEMLFAKRKDLDYVASIDAIRYDNFLSCDSMAFDFDLGRDLWLTKARFTVLQRTYLNLGELMAFLDRCEAIGLGEAKRGVITAMQAAKHPLRDRKYRWGGCMLGWSFRGGDRYGKPTLTMHSRVSYVPYIGGADLALCNVMAREIGKRIGKKPEDFAFNWVLDSAQYHFFKALPYLFRFELDEVFRDKKGYPDDKYPTIKGIRRWYFDMVRKYEEGIPVEDEKYGPLKRIRKRYQQYMEGNPLPSVPISQLNFQPLKDRG